MVASTDSAQRDGDGALLPARSQRHYRKTTGAARGLMFWGRFGSRRGPPFQPRKGRCSCAQPVNRKLSRFEEAERHCGAGALRMGGRQASRLTGSASSMHGVGNIPRAKKTSVRFCRRRQHQDAYEASSSKTPVGIQHRGQPAEALPNVWRSRDLYEAIAVRASRDVGIMLLTTGERGARSAANRGVGRWSAHTSRTQ